MNSDPLVYRLEQGGVFAAATFFLVLFLVFEPWRKNLYGWIVVVLASGLWLFGFTGTLKNILGSEYPFRDTIREVANGLVLLGLLQQSYIVLRERRRHRPTEDA